MRRFTSDDLNPMSWQEYGAVIESLIVEIRASGIAFDAIAPILRSGGIPGSALAIHFEIPRMIPLQFKYGSDPSCPVAVISTHSIGENETPSKILICENNTSSGATARAAAALLKSWFPAASLYYATVALVFTGSELAIPAVEQVFVGIRTNERLLASSDQAGKLKLRPGITLFPWENAEDELSEMNKTPLNLEPPATTAPRHPAAP